MKPALAFVLFPTLLCLLMGCGEKPKDTSANPKASVAAETPPKEIAYKKLKYVEAGGGAIYDDPDTGKPFTGLARDYHPNGQLHMECPFKDGKMNGLVREWYPSGKKLAETEFVDGTRTGKNTEWNDAGALFRERVYDHDKIVSEKNYEAGK